MRSMNRGALLQFWQLTAIAGLLEIRAKDKLRGAVLGDTVGLGKKWEGQVLAGIQLKLKLKGSSPRQELQRRQCLSTAYSIGSLRLATFNAMRNHREDEPLCSSRLDLMLITAKDMEEARLRLFFNDLASNVVDARTKAVDSF
ncbi:hypothetical protein CNMCM6069_007880 [Aspergillus lentulus]|nr:hypothetical protein CNMCM6069_007880 [Aspergillus lentulus]